MNRFFVGFLAVGAFALMIGHATAGGTNGNNNPNPTDDSSGVMLIESYTVSTAPSNNDMQPLPQDPGVEVAPLNSDSSQPVAVEEDITVQQTSDDE
jgi:hypothetical protein